MSGVGQDYYKSSENLLKEIKIRYSNYGFINTRVKPL